MTLPIAESNLIVGAILLGILGIVECFFGYRVFRIVLAVFGFFIGAGLAMTLIHSDQNLVNLIVGLIGGILGATIFYFLYFVGTFMAGIFLGATVAAILAGNLNLASNVATILIVIGAAIGGALALCSVSTLSCSVPRLLAQPKWSTRYSCCSLAYGSCRPLTRSNFGSVLLSRSLPLLSSYSWRQSALQPSIA